MTPANDNSTATWSSSRSEEANGRYRAELRFGQDLIREAGGIERPDRASAIAGEWLILAMRGKIASKPAKRLDGTLQEVQERRFKRRPAQVFDTSALPLFGDQRHQLELF